MDSVLLIGGLFCSDKSNERIFLLYVISPFIRRALKDYGTFQKITNDNVNPVIAIKYSGVLQFSSLKQYTAKIAINLPKIAIKLTNKSDLPLYFCGISSDRRVLAIISVIPNPIPEIIRINRKLMNWWEYTIIKLETPEIVWPKIKVAFRPDRLARVPAKKDPAMIPQ